MENLLIYGDNLNSVNKKVFSCVKDNLPLFNNHIIIVPDKYTMLAEEGVLRACKTKASFKINVLTLSRLATLLTGNSDNLSKQGGVMLIRKLCEENKDKLKYFNTLAGKVGFAEIIYDTIMQLKSCVISYDQIDENGDDLLSNKMADIRLIYKLYEESIKDKFVDSAQRLELLRKSILGNVEIKNTAFYFTNFDSLTNQGYEIVGEIVKNGNKVVFGAVYEDEKLNKFVYDNELFEKVEEIFIQKGNYRKVRAYSDFEGDFAVLNNYLYSFGNREYISSGNVEVHSFFSPVLELEEVAKRIKRAVIEGKRFKDFSLLLSSFDCYKSLKQVFDKFEISYYFDTSEKLITHPLSRFILSFYNAILSEFHLSSVMSLVKNIYFGVQDENIFPFENYVNRYNLNGKWFSGFVLNEDEENYEELKEVVFRLKFIDVFFAKAAEIRTGGDFIVLTENLLEAFNAEEKTEEVKNLASSFDVISQLGQGYKKIKNILNEMKKFITEEEMDIQTFVDILSSGLNSDKINTVPLTTDGVFVGDQSSEFEKCNTLFVLGCNSGSMPQVLNDCGIISDKEIDNLSVKYLISPKTSVITKRNKFKLFQRLLNCDNLVVSYPNTSSSGEEVKPSPLIASIKKLFIDMPIISGHLESLEEISREDVKVLASEVGSYKNAVDCLLKNKENNVLKNSLYSALKNVDKQKIMGLLSLSNSGAQTKIKRAKELYFNNKKVSVSTLSTYFDCPTKFFLEKGLKLKENEKAEIKSVDTGNILHKVAELLLKQPKEKRKDAATCKKVVKKAFEEFSEVVEATKDVSIIKSLEKEAFAVIDYLNYFDDNCLFETSIKPELRFDDFVLNEENNICLNGVIDRIDTLSGNCIIIDYKTGSVGDKPYNLNAIYAGTKIQILVYAFIANSKLNLTPIACGLMPLSYDYVNNDGNRYAVKGLYTDNEEILSNLDKNFIGDGESVLFDYKKNKEKLSNNCYPQAVLNGIYNYVMKLIKNAVDEILSGYVACKPVSIDGASPCKYCKFGAICKNVLNDKKRIVSKTKIEDITGVVQYEE